MELLNRAVKPSGLKKGFVADIPDQIDNSGNAFCGERTGSSSNYSAV
jgi:hypothetical protein